MTAPSWPLLAATAAQCLVLGIVFYLLPQWSRSGHFFALTVDPSFRESEPGRRILRSYRRQVLVLTVLSGALVLWLAGPVMSSLGVLLPVIGFFAVFLNARRQVRPFVVEPDLVREVTLHEAETPAVASWPWQIGPFLILLTGAVILWLNWDLLPDTYVRHWNAQMEPDGWGTKHWRSLGMPLMIGAALCFGMQWMAASLASRVRRVDASGDAAASEQERRRAISNLILVVSYFMAVLFSAIAMTPFAQEPGQAKLALVGILSLSIFGSLGMVLYMAVMMPKFQAAQRTQESPSDRSADDKWIAGVFYYAPEDPAVWVEKRVGIGYTLNMAHRSARWILFLLLGLPVLVIAGAVWLG